MESQGTCRRSARTALLVTGPATSPTNLDMALPSLVPAWWNTPSLLFSVMHWFLMIVFSPVGLKAPPQVCPGVRHWDTGARRSKKGKRVILIFFLLRLAFVFTVFLCLFYFHLVFSFRSLSSGLSQCNGETVLGRWVEYELRILWSLKSILDPDQHTQAILTSLIGKKSRISEYSISPILWLRSDFGRDLGWTDQERTTEEFEGRKKFREKGKEPRAQCPRPLALKLVTGNSNWAATALVQY